ncbi:MAG TPA: autotransporter-associated beta strand repeat-containing protein [Kiritimatiellia bacterium]|nr:autotransporter-associated beta strand repeat-containing protein [Kiritimatiellia bacterium]HPS07187.1 autotransporter-associated beta strand repeat-containing protein [Kiritimatiellia bacterium]
MAAWFKDVPVCLVFLIFTAGVNAAERIWTGGGGDALWSNPANWASGAPDAGDTLVFGASSARDITNNFSAGTAFAGITFLAGSGGKFTLSGNAFTLKGDLTTFSGYTPEIALPLILGTDCQCLGSNGTLAISGAISGPGGLRFEGNTASGVTFTLSGDNTFEGPVVVTNRARLVVSSPSALGSPAAGTTVYGPNETWLQISGGITLGEPITLLGSDGGPNYHPCLKSYSGTNTLSAPIYSTSLGFRMRVYADALILRGGVISPDTTGTFYFETSTGTEIVVTNRPLFLGNGAGLYSSYGGKLVLAEPGNTYAVLHAYAGSTVLATAPNALAPYGIVRCGISWWDKDTSMFDLNGFCQTVGPLESYALPSGVHVITSAVPTVLTVVQRYNSTFRGDIAGAVSLYKTGASTLTLTNLTPMTTSGRVTVAAGTLALGNAAGSAGGFGAVPAVRVLPGGTLALNNGAGLPDTSEINVFTGGVLSNGMINVRAGTTETVARFYIEGAQQASGTWGATGSGATHINDVFFSGGGLLSVTDDPAVAYTEVVWDKEGGDTLMSTKENWSGDTLPAFTGYERAVFGAGAGPAGVDTNASFYKMVINWPSSDFHFDNIAGGGSLTLGRGGIEIPGPASTRYNRIRVPVTLADDQFITLTNGYVFFEQPLSDGGNGFGLTVCNPSRGNAAVIPQNQNTYSGKTVLKNRSIIYIRGSGDVLGSTAGDTLVENGSYLYIDTEDNAKGLTVAEPIVLDGDGTLSYSGTLQNYRGTNVLTGPISGLNNSARIRSTTVGSKLDITGGITADATGGSCILATDGGGTITVREKPVYANTFYANGKSVGGMVVIAATGNVTRTCYMNANVRLGAQEAFEYLGNLILGNDGRIANIDLNGCGLTVRRSLRTDVNSTNSLIFSAAPATLTVDQTVDTTYGGSFAGAVSLIKRGAGTLTLTNEMDRSTTTSGGVTVKAGTLKIAGDYGSLGPACTNITVEGTGTLALESAVSMLSDDAAVRLVPANAGSAKISLAAGVDETVGWFFCGGEPMYPGTYGAAGSGAEYVDDSRFAGSGVLRVLHGKAKGMIFSLY